jgi:glutamine amidotransferase
MIAIIDYGAGNLRSVTNALVKLGYQPRVTGESSDVLSAGAVIFPGVGAAPDTVRNLKKLGLDYAVKQVIREARPLFAICVGMQVLLSITEEDGPYECLGIIPGVVKRLPSGLKVPHMGWNQVKQVTAHAIFNDIPDESNFYFVHSYYAEPDDTGVIAGATEYGVTFCSVLIKDNLIATQFHPEKSGEIGLRMYYNFLKLAGIER